MQKQIDELGGGSNPDFDLVNGQHSSEQCVDVGGVVEIIPDGKICRVPGYCISYGLTAYQAWGSTQSKTFYETCYICRDNGGCPPGTLTSFQDSCSVTGHTWENKATESCQPISTACTGTYYAPVTESGCY